MTSMRTIASAFAILFAIGFSMPTARAQEPSAEDRAAAQVVFEEGRKLSEAGDWKGACKKFEESMRLHLATGTQLNLARCYENIGKFASAWINWVEAKERALANDQAKRAKLAAERADALEGRISFLTIRVQEPVDGLVVLRDGSEVGKAQWGSKVPIDGGTHRIEVRAPGYTAWQKSVKIKNERAHVVVRVPRLDKQATAPLPSPEPTVVVVPDPAPDAPDTPDTDRGINYQGISGVVIAILGAGGIGVGIGFGVAAGAKNDDSLTHCPDVPSRCTAAGVALRNDAFTLAHVSTAGFIGGGVLMFTGVILLATSFGGASAETAALTVMPAPGGIGLGGRW
jgi:hypothetical protein